MPNLAFTLVTICNTVSSGHGYLPWRIIGSFGFTTYCTIILVDASPFIRASYSLGQQRIPCSTPHSDGSFVVHPLVDLQYLSSIIQVVLRQQSKKWVLMRIRSVTDTRVSELKGGPSVLYFNQREWELRSCLLAFEVVRRGEVRCKCRTQHANVLSRTSARKLASLYL